MDKKRLKIAIALLNAVRSTFPETNKFIDSTLKEECEKEKMTADEVIFFASKIAKKKAQINIFVLNLVLWSLFFCLQIWKGVADSKKAKRLSKEEIKKQLLDLMIIDEVVNKEAEEIQDLEKAVEIINGMKILLK